MGSGVTRNGFTPSRLTRNRPIREACGGKETKASASKRETAAMSQVHGYAATAWFFPEKPTLQQHRCTLLHALQALRRGWLESSVHARAEKFPAKDNPRVAADAGGALRWRGCSRRLAVGAGDANSSTSALSEKRSNYSSE